MSTSSTQRWKDTSRSWWSPMCALLNAARHGFEVHVFFTFVTFLLLSFFTFVTFCKHGTVLWSLRMGKQEGMATKNKEKKEVHDVWLKDKLDTRFRDWCSKLLLGGLLCFFLTLCLFSSNSVPCAAWRPAWFVHENVRRFPGKFLEDPLGDAGYGSHHTTISPQRFGKPMCRLGQCLKCCVKGYLISCLFHAVIHTFYHLLIRTRSYRIFWDKKKFFWKGPPLRDILKAVLPHQPLKLTADDMFFLTDEELVPWLNFRNMFVIDFGHHVFTQPLKVVLCARAYLRLRSVAVLSCLTWPCPIRPQTSRRSMSSALGQRMCGKLGWYFCNFWYIKPLVRCLIVWRFVLVQ